MLTSIGLPRTVSEAYNKPASMLSSFSVGIITAVSNTTIGLVSTWITYQLGVEAETDHE